MAASTLTIAGTVTIELTKKPLSLSVPFERTPTNNAILGVSSTKAYGRNIVNGRYTTSTDGVNWTDELQSVVTFTPNILEIVVDETNSLMYAVPSDAKLYRATLDDFASWVEIQPPTLPANTTGRSGCLKTNGTYLFYGNYNQNNVDRAQIYRSADNGDTWTVVANLTNGRHVHAVYVDPTNSARIFAVIGDANDADKGLWVSLNSGDTWTHLSSNFYGINLVYQPTTGGVPARIVMEGDGNIDAHILHYPYSMIETPSPTFATNMWYTSEEPGNWKGTIRAMCLTSNGDLFYVSTSENLGIPQSEKDAIWLAKGSDFSRRIMLEDITEDKFAYYHTKEFNGYLLYNRYRTPLPVIL